MPRALLIALVSVSLPAWAGAAEATLPASPLKAAGGASEFFEVDGVKLHYLIQGKGEPVVLIHGLHASAQRNWVLPGVFGDLAAHYQVIAPDMPGHGKSDRPTDDDAYGTQMADDVVALLDHLKIDKAHIAGYSMGGMVTVKLMARHPERVRSALVGGMGWVREGSRHQRFWEQLPARDRSRTPQACTRGMAQLAVSEQDLVGIKLPVEIVVGNRDPVKRIYVEPLRSVRYDWEVVEIPDAGHINCIAKPAFGETITQWLERQSARAKAGQ